MAKPVCLTLTLWTLLAAFAVAEPAAPLPTATVEAIEALLQREMQSQQIPGLSAAVAHQNRLCYQGGLGTADLEHQAAARPDTRYRTASIAKSLTAVLVLRLAELEKLDLDADVRDYCPSFPAKRWPVTCRQLLGHLGGVRHYRRPLESVGTRHFDQVQSALTLFSDDPLLHEPGTRFHYTTFGYNLLGAVAERSADATFMSLLEKHVLEPAEMRATRRDDHFAIVPHRARGYVKVTPALAARQRLNGRFPPQTLINAELHDTSMKVPGGGLLSTAPDLARFAAAVNQGKLLAAATVDAMWSSQQTREGKETGYGLGWKVGTTNGNKFAAHSGGQAGTSTYLLTLPRTGTCVALMCNLQGARLQPLAEAIAAVVQQPVSVDGEQKVIEKLRAAIAYEVQAHDLPSFALSLVEGDRLVWSDAFGYQDADRKTPAATDTVYRVGSVSKLFTDIAVMQLVEQSKLDLDAPVQQYLPDFQPRNPHDKPITLRQLMTHRSGLVRESPVGNYFDDSEPDLARTVASLNDTSLVYAPDTKTKYSNAAIAVVGAVLEKQLRDTHAAHVKRTLLAPLGMRHSSFSLEPAVQEKLATAWMRTYDGRRFEAPTFLLGTGPAGNMYASVDDLAKFLVCLLNQGQTPDGQTLIKEATLQQMLVPQTNPDGSPQEFGIGFHVQQFEGHRKIGHGGAVYGFSTQLEALPERKLGVAAVASLDGSNALVRRLADYGLRLMLAHQDGKPLPDYQVTRAVPPQRARELVGTYRELQGDRYARIVHLDGKLTLHRGVYQYQLRSAADTGEILVDDPLGFGTRVTQIDAKDLRIDDVTYRRVGEQPPAAPPARWRGLIGEYGWDHNILYILEDHGQLYALIEWFFYYPLKEVSENKFSFPDYGLYHGEGLEFTRNASGTATAVVAAEVRFPRRSAGTPDGETFRITPVKPIDELRAAALAAMPPLESGEFREASLVELTSLDETIRRDIRYATTNNFTGAVFYRQPRAYLQRPAAEAVVRAHRKLQPLGLGLLIHDAYRPWHVTKMFWDATPAEFKDFVANPANGSRHNRGCAVDLTLYDLKSGKPIQMVAGYDEFSHRSFPLYPGGTSRQRWYRDLLRSVMESEGFTVYEYEWWHFDYRDWKKYRIANQPFEAFESK